LHRTAAAALQQHEQLQLQAEASTQVIMRKRRKVSSFNPAARSADRDHEFDSESASSSN